MFNSEMRSPVTTFSINQATTHKFRDLYIANTMLVLIESGSKCVKPDDVTQLEAREGELLIFPSGTFITIENRTISGRDYVAHCISYPDDMIETIFDKTAQIHDNPSAIYVGACPQPFKALLKTISKIEHNPSLPKEIVRYRQLEPLMWLKSMGVMLTTPIERTLDRRLRDLITTDLAHKWRVEMVATSLGFSEPTFRRRLQKLNTSFSEVLMTVRLEQALSLLQTTNQSISMIAETCGFSTPSHFSDVFKARFDISPKHIRQSNH